MEKTREHIHIKDRECPFCHNEIVAEEIHYCEACGANHHGACWQEAGGCSIAGCNLQASSAGQQVEEQQADQEEQDATADREIERLRLIAQIEHERSNRKLLLGMIVFAVIAAVTYFFVSHPAPHLIIEKITGEMIFAFLIISGMLIHYLGKD